MVGYTEPPPPVPDPGLANLTYEQLVALINEGNPNDFYLEASAFDEASGRLRQLLDDFLRESRQLQTFVNGELLIAIEEVTRRHAARIDSVLEPMLHPGYAQGLRQAGDALATGQQRVRDMQLQNAQQDPAVPPPPEQPEQQRLQALQILHDISTAYRDIGGTFSPLPETVSNGNVNNVNVNNVNLNNSNSSTGDTTFTNGQGPGGNPVFVAGRYHADQTFSPTHNADSFSGGGESPAAKSTGPGVFVTGDVPPPGVFAGGAPVAGGAMMSALGRPVGTVCGESNSEPQAERLEATEGVEGEAAPAALLSAGVLASGVLGRSATGARDQRKQTSRKESTTEASEVEEQEVLAALKDGERPETVSATVPAARQALTQDLAQLPQTAAVPTVSAAVPAIPAVQSASSHGVSIPAFDVRAEFGPTATAGAGSVDPEERGMFVPANAAGAGGGRGGELSTELSAAQGLPMITPMVGPGSAAGGGVSGGGAAQGMGAMPPPMMMGGMGGMGSMRGGGGQDAERFADVPVTPEAEVWDPLRATGAVLGRPEQAPEPSEPSEPCSEQDVDAARQAAIQEILGKTGGKRS